MIHPSTPGAEDREGGDGPSASLRGAPRLELVGTLALRWNHFRRQVVAAKATRAKVRETLGPCKKIEAGYSPCWTEGRTMGADWCESCKAQEPTHIAYQKAVRKAAATLTSLRRAMRELEAEGLPEASSPKGPLPATPEVTP